MPRVSLLLIPPVVELGIVHALQEILGHMAGTKRERLLSVGVCALLYVGAAAMRDVLRRVRIP